ncbi:MAG: hypothetical protein V9G14_05630 [Cypionkella sp.]
MLVDDQIEFGLQFDYHRRAAITEENTPPARRIRTPSRHSSGAASGKSKANQSTS